MVITGMLTVSNPKMDDERRTISSFESAEGSFEVGHFIIKQTTTAPLGNHYHRWKTETFLILEGSGSLTYANVVEVDGKPAYSGELTILPLSPGTVVHILPYTAHAFHLREGSLMVCWSSKPYDGQDQPTFKIV